MVQAQVLLYPKVRLTFLSPCLLRLEYSAQNAFVDKPTFIFMERNFAPARVTIEERKEWKIFKLPAMELHYRPDGRSLGPQNVKITWTHQGKARTWRPGQTDATNLGGYCASLDRLGRDTILSMKPGLLNREGYWMVDDSMAPVYDKKADLLIPSGEELCQDFYFCVYGNDFPLGIREFIKQSGPAPRLPLSAFGLWFSRYFNFQDSEIKALVDEFNKQKLPLDVFVIDVDWHLHGWDGYDWNRSCFPHPEKFLQWMHAQGVKVMLNIHPEKLSRKDTHFPAVAKATGTPADKPYIVFDGLEKTHVHAYTRLLQELLNTGADYLWSDGNLISKAPADALGWNNRIFYNSAAEQAKERALILSRSGGLGSHRTPAYFSGDTHSHWETLSYEIDFTARAANLGPSVWSHDIGGFIGLHLPADLYLRWVAFGAFSPMLRLHSSFGVREPWNYGKEALDIFRKVILLRRALLPYLANLDEESHCEGLALVRPLYFQYPDDEKAYTVKGEYLLGNGLLVAPACTPNTGDCTQKEVYLPNGTWFNFFSGTRWDGPRKMALLVQLGEIPVFARAGAIIPLDERNTSATESPFPKALVLRVFAGGAGQYSLREDDGKTPEPLLSETLVTEFEYLEEEDGNILFNCKPQAPATFKRLARRIFSLEFYGLTCPQKVMCGTRELARNEKENFKAGTWNYCAEKHRVVVNMGKRKIAESWSLLLVASALIPEEKIKVSNAPSEIAARLFSTPPVGNTNELKKGTIPGPDPVAFNITSFRQGTLFLELALNLPGSKKKPIISGFKVVPPKGLDIRKYQPLRLTQAHRADGIRWVAMLKIELKPPQSMPLGGLEFKLEYQLDGMARKTRATALVTADYLQFFNIIGPFPYRREDFLTQKYGPETNLNSGVTYQGKAWPIAWRKRAYGFYTEQQSLSTRFVDLKTHFHIYGFESNVRLTEQYPDYLSLQQGLYPNYFSTAYASTFLHANRAGTAVLSLGTDEDFMLYLDNQLVAEKSRAAAPGFPEKKIPLRLKKGWNRLLLKIGQEDRLWEFYMRIKAPAGMHLRTAYNPKHA